MKNYFNSKRAYLELALHSMFSSDIQEAIKMNKNLENIYQKRCYAEDIRCRYTKLLNNAEFYLQGMHDPCSDKEYLYIITIPEATLLLADMVDPTTTLKEFKVVLKRFINSYSELFSFEPPLP